MKIRLTIKLFLYRFFSTSFGKAILKSLDFGVKVENLGNETSQKNHQFFVVLTVDSESGYVGKDERRIWQRENPTAFIGYSSGIRNLTKIFDKHKVKATFFLSTNCFSSKGKEYDKIKKEIGFAIKNGHEIGLHLHPDSDLAIQKKLSRKFKATSAFFYDYEEKLQIINAAKELVRQHLGNKAAEKLTSFRWGNWALDSDGAKALGKAGFKIDSSATPGIKGHTNDAMKYDWSRVSTHYPWKLNLDNYQAAASGDSGNMEIPIATFEFFGLKLRADPVNSVLLNKACAEYYKNADRSNKPFPFVVITHSSEATYLDGRPTKAVKDLEEFILFAKNYDKVKFVTLQEAYERLS
ncbi:polysaccharide deacetylase family protein [Candidatus Woesearchaeota archaeon]|nr:polysaccharide deacetylase family protein [Candidatus Woesearchaeota archaeon]